jgi:hypothetical protein
MKPSEDLHELIRSMSMSEKRYFKIHASRHTIGTINNYTRLFDAVEAQQDYDEAKVKSAFAGENFIRHLPSEKNYLYHQVLESLNAFNREKTFLSRHAEILTAIEVLYNRGLFGHAKKLIRKAKKEAYSLEKFSLLLILVHWETVLFINDEDDRALSASIREEIRLIEALKVQTQLMKVAFDIQVRIDKGAADKAFIRRAKTQLAGIYPPAPEANGFWASYYYYSALALLYTIENNNNERYRCYREIKKLMDAAPQFIRDLPAIYLLNYNNLVNIMLFLKKFAETAVLLKQQRTFLAEHKIRNPNFETRVFINTFESELYLLYKTAQHDKAAEIASEIEPALKKIPGTFGPILFDLYYFMAITGLMAKNHKSASRWLNRILNAEGQINFRTELQINARLLYLVILCETNDVLFDNRLKAARRFLAAAGGFKKQRLILEAIALAEQDLALTANRRALKDIVTQLKKQHQVAREELLNKNFDFTEWLENRLKAN